jgi:tripartite-type tricarboxylate transporter receptor subunit TctC
VNWMTHRAAKTAIAALAISFAGVAQADAFPTGPVTVVVPFGAGDAVDGTARVIADRMKNELRVPVIVQNIPGAGGAKGAAEVKRANADGHTLLMGSTGALTAAPQISNTGYETDDFVPIAQLVEAPLGVAVRADSPHKTLADLIKAAKTEDGGLTYATPAPGSTQHINMTAFAKENGMNLTHIGGQGGKGAMTKALTGEVDFAFIGASNYVGMVDAGQLRVLGVTDAERLSFLPDAPTFKEQGYDLEAAVWFGLLTSRDVPQERVEQLRKLVGEIAQDPKTLELYEKFHFEPAYLDAEAFGERIQENVASNKETLTDLGLAQK